YRIERFTPGGPNAINLYNQHVKSHKHNVFAVIESLMHRNSKRESATPRHSSPVASPKSQRLGFHSYSASTIMINHRHSQYHLHTTTYNEALINTIKEEGGYNATRKICADDDHVLRIQSDGIKRSTDGKTKKTNTYITKEVRIQTSSTIYHRLHQDSTITKT
ncbi:8589_t:CDS:2, partial [Acaulospora morrowiae]